MTTLRRPTAQARRDYRAQLGPDADWGRPTKQTARAIWAVLKDDLPIQLDDLLPKRGQGPGLAGDEYDAAVLVAQQSLAVALDVAVVTDGLGGQLSFNRMLAALAERWSLTFADCRQRGIRSLYDLKESTVRQIWREMVLVGLRVDTLWAVVAGPWSRASLNPLYHLSRIPQALGARRHGKRRDPRPVRMGWSVEVRDSEIRRRFEAVLDADPYYRRPIEHRLYLASEPDHHARRIRQEWCEESPSNVVEVGEHSELVLQALEGARLRFNVETFRADFEAAEAAGDKDFVKTLRHIYDQTTGLMLEADDPTQPAYRTIRSRFFKAINRRYNALDFWPEHVSSEYRSRWFSFDGAPMVGQDISSSQTQILSVFLGLEDLEALATSTTPKFKVWLARECWALHEKEGDLLADGYTGPDDPRLVSFMKEHWMRRMYGGRLSEIIYDLRRGPDTYGPGWCYTEQLSGAMGRAKRFLRSLPSWHRDVERFLEACQYLGRQAAPRGGLVLTDPFDSARVKWNPAQWTTHQVQCAPRVKVDIGVHGHHRKVSGERTWRFTRAPVGTVHPGELANMTAPCLIHMLDAAFSSFVILTLRAWGVQNIVAIHDDWSVSSAYLKPPPYKGAETVPGASALGLAIDIAGEPWMKSLAPVYDRLADALRDTPHEGLFAEIRAKWVARAKAGGWPRFTAG